MPTVEARYLSGDAVFLEKCDTVGHIMVRIAIVHQRLASDVVVVCPETGKDLTDSHTHIPPLLVSIIIKPCEVLPNEDDLRLSLRLHAEHDDTRTCARVLDMLRDAHLVDPVATDMISDAARGESEGERRIAQTLVRVGVDGAAAMLQASSCADKHAVERLLAAGVSPNSADQWGRTALFMASSEGHSSVVDMLLAAHATVDATDNFRRTALFIASCFGLENVVDALLFAKANVDHADNGGYTALILASRIGRKDVAERLLAARAHVDQANKKHESPLIIASREGCKDVVATLLAAGANVDHTDDAGGRAVLIASTLGHADVVDTLLAAGANVDH
eukprot:GEMP01052870.1.p1 GENE.GEMP01052870.1~~GEMP01052870.1.p1  ORF type:complete len:335 (+),score=80.58 GEMP01052870.1:121-1125(+)